MAGGGAPETRSGRRGSLSEVNVTPLVDVMLVLLIIFMVTTPMMQQGIDVNLPETASSGIAMKEEPFVLSIRSDQTIFAGKAKIPADQLRKKLQAIYSERENKQIYIQADREVSYGFVAEVMGEIRAAGIFNIGLVTLPKN